MLAAMSAPLRPGFGPSLPALLRDRFGIAPRTTAIVAAVLAAAIAFAVAATALTGGDEQLVHEGDPVFNLVYDDRAVRETAPRSGELVRLEGRRGGASAAVTVRPLPLPEFRGDVAKGLLPVLAQRRLDDLRRRDPALLVIEEGRSSVNTSPGYQIAYRTGRPGSHEYWREIFVVPDEEAPRLGVVLSFVNERRGTTRARQLDFILTARSAFRSFRFGRDRG